MFRFSKKNKKVEIDICEKTYIVDEDVRDYMIAMRNRLNDMSKELFDKTQENGRLKTQLEEIYKVQNEYGLKPAFSQDCVDCKYALLSESTKRPIACRKDRLCYDFVPVED